MPFRQLIIPPIYIILYGFTYLLAYSLRFDFEVPSEVWGRFLATFPLVIATKSLVNLLTRQWRRKHRYTSLVDVIYVTGDAFLQRHYFWPSMPFCPRES